MKSLNPAASRPTGGYSAVAELAEQQRLRLLSPRKWIRESMEISTDPALLNLPLIAQWLADKFPDIRNLRLALSGSLCFGLYRNGRQIGFARIVTDMVDTWVIRDLFISPEYRFIGLGSWLLNCSVAHPAARGCRRILCLSESAPAFLERNGFSSHPALPGIYVAEVAFSGLLISALTESARRH
ncbi:GNAT family N-acetyltransferase [Mixta gaviniae]|uniref:N-acetyltransferase n=1 Tax=Mixta gaviniae TaxID=665914 RepID=A0A1X1E729_9GAMM|nr:GNAT family N-acetyltransferase [Mixta gaviniae]AUX95004.1 N-acetyltransferase [Mixta gaviniae]ORM84726.1 N-acetyltransferase [Mixta gaviniae]